MTGLPLGTFSWSELIGLGAIVVPLCVSIVELKKHTRELRNSNQIALLDQRTRIWLAALGRLELVRVTDPARGNSDEPPSTDEVIFVLSLINLMGTAYSLHAEGATMPIEGMRADAANFFASKTTRAIWNQFERYQNKDFAEFVGSCLFSMKTETINVK